MSEDMPEMWYNSLNDALAETIANPGYRQIPDSVKSRLYHLELGYSSTSTLRTLKMLQVMANTALQMVLDFTPAIAKEVRRLMELKSPEAYAQILAWLHQFGQNEPDEMIFARNCAATLIPATRDTRSRGGNDFNLITELPTAAAVAMWTAVYSTHRAHMGQERSDGLIALMLTSLRP